MMILCLTARSFAFANSDWACCLRSRTVEASAKPTALRFTGLPLSAVRAPRVLYLFRSIFLTALFCRSFQPKYAAQSCTTMTWSTIIRQSTAAYRVSRMVRWSGRTTTARASADSSAVGGPISPPSWISTTCTCGWWLCVGLRTDQVLTNTHSVFNDFYDRMKIVDLSPFVTRVFVKPATFWLHAQVTALRSNQPCCTYS